MEVMGVYFVTSNFGFTMQYLQLTLLRFLPANLAPGQEASGRSLQQNGQPLSITKEQFRLYLMHALKGYVLAKRTPHEVVMFPVANPAQHIPLTNGVFLFPVGNTVKILSFDGHFGVHHVLHKELEEKRTVALRGRPKKKKKYHPDQRTCTCANKDKRRDVPVNRTGGWQFVIDPQSRKVVAAKEHIVNECIPDKAEVVLAAMGMTKVSVNAVIHDDARHFEAYVKKSKKLKAAFRKVKHFIVDEFHRCNHKCSKKKLSKSESKPFNLREMPMLITRRSTVSTRKRPAAAR